MSDPLQPSPEQRAREDQLRAAVREFAATLQTIVYELVGDGWTDQQARELIVASMRQQSWRQQP
jgi:hypothetical protein